MPYFQSTAPAQSAPFQMVFSPNPGRDQLVAAIEAFLHKGLSALFAVLADGRVFGAVAPRQVDWLSTWAEALAKKVGKDTRAEVIAPFKFAHPRDTFALVPVPQRAEFKLSVPPAAQIWATQLLGGVQVTERRVGQPATVIWGRQYQGGEYIQDTLLAMSVQLRFGEDRSYTDADSNAGILAEALEAPCYWMFRNIQGVTRFERG
jgi:hypothetical protein